MQRIGNQWTRLIVLLWKVIINEVFLSYIKIHWSTLYFEWIYHPSIIGSQYSLVILNISVHKTSGLSDTLPYTILKHHINWYHYSSHQKSLLVVGTVKLTVVHTNLPQFWFLPQNSEFNFENTVVSFPRKMTGLLHLLFWKLPPNAQVEVIIVCVSVILSSKYDVS